MMTSFLPSFFLAVRAGNRGPREVQKGKSCPRRRQVQALASTHRAVTT